MTTKQVNNDKTEIEKHIVDENTPAMESDIPEEFQTVTMGELPETNDWLVNPIVTGVVLQIKECVIGEGKQANHTAFMIVEHDRTRTTVWRSAALYDIFAIAKPDDEVYIKYIGEVQTRNSLNKMKQFKTGIKAHGRDVGAE